MKPLNETELLEFIRVQQPIKLSEMLSAHGLNGYQHYNDFDPLLQALRKAGKIKYTPKGWVTL